MAGGSVGLMRIGEVARRSGVSVKALRFYEEVGVVGPSARSPAGYRLYDPSVVDRVACVRAAQAAGLSLSEIVELFAALDDPSRPDALDRIAGCRECLEATLEALGVLRRVLDESPRPARSPSGEVQRRVSP